MIDSKEDSRKRASSFLFYIRMRYFSKPPPLSVQSYGEVYICDHPLYSKCTLYRDKEKGLAIIQQRFDAKKKHTYWAEIDAWIANALYLKPKFHLYFKEHAKPPENGLYPTVSVRQIMWAVRMKPLKKERWETVFDRKDI